MMDMPEHFHTGQGELRIDLNAISNNYLWLKSLAEPATCSAVVKANAYGLGLDQVAPALKNAGCQVFFIATLAEGVRLRQLLADIDIYILNGLMPEQAALFTEFNLMPVLNDLAQVRAWVAHCRLNQQQYPAAIHLDTGMNRLGLSAKEVEALLPNVGMLEAMQVKYWMSHLACSTESSNPMNAEQLTRFTALLEQLPPAPASLSNSAGILLGKSYHFDLVRPGLALYGGNPWDQPAPLSPVVRLLAPILQVREVKSPATIGYDATYKVEKPMRVAAIAAGYADGFGSFFSNRGYAMIDGEKAPFLGRVSMDSMMLDVTHIPVDKTRPGTRVELIGPQHTINTGANTAGILSYEMLTGLGARYRKIYLEASCHVRE
ncbi:MAG: alanine racemase [Pseudomonadota bacterium]